MIVVLHMVCPPVEGLGFVCVLHFHNYRLVYIYLPLRVNAPPLLRQLVIFLLVFLAVYIYSLISISHIVSWPL